MKKPNKKIVIIAGEASGDLHASNLVQELKNIEPSIEFYGLGGKKMADKGVKIFYDLTKLAIVGFWEVLKHYLTLRKVFFNTLKEIKKLQPDAVILVDYPGFNLRLAKKIKALKLKKTKVIYYISPQIWAWKKNRIKTIKKVIDKVLVIFDFEKKFYSDLGVDACFVGHPLADEVRSNIPKDKFLAAIGLKEYNYTIGLLPGSREKEIEKLFPIMLDAVKLIKQYFPMSQFIIFKAPTIEDSQMRHFNEIAPDIKIIAENHYDGLNACDVCVVASGTATLEVGLMQKPMVIVYKTSLPTWLLAKLFVKIPYVGLVNIVAGRQIVPELLQYEATGENIAKEIKEFINNDTKTSDTKSYLHQVKKILGLGGGYRKAAEEILQAI